MRRIAFALLALFLAGCAHLGEDSHFVSFAEGIEGRIAATVRNDPVLTALIEAYDPHFESFHDGENACFYPAAPDLAGFYNSGKLCRNPAMTLSDPALASILRHEFLHLVWYRLTPTQKNAWRAHLIANPSPWEEFVLTHCSGDLDNELFAYTLEGTIRPVDGAALVRLGILPERFAAGDTTLPNRFLSGHARTAY